MRRAIWFGRGIRFRLTALAVLAVTAPLLLGAFGTTTLLQRSLLNSLIERQRGDARLVATEITQHGVGDISEIRDEVHEDSRIEVFDQSRLIYTSNPAAAVLATPQTLGVGQTKVTGAQQFWTYGDPKQPVVVQLGAAVDGRPLTIAVSSSQVPVHEAVLKALVILLGGVPLLMALTALVAWWLVGRALRPVEVIRSEVDQITAADLAARVPVPPTHDEIGTLATTMNHMLSRLELSAGQQRRFVADASHELRSPLATVSASLELVRDNPNDGPLRTEMTALMVGEVARMRALVEDLLLLSRTDSTGVRLRPNELDLDDLVETEVRRLRGLTSLRIEMQLRPVRMIGDAARLTQVLRNLGDNALRHAESRVRFTLATDDGWAILAIDDDGAGVAEQDRERIFERFVRLDESRSRDSGGSGLGLAIVAELVAAHGGTVRVGESPLQGAGFVLRLPLQAQETHSEFIR